MKNNKQNQFVSLKSVFLLILTVLHYFLSIVNAYINNLLLTLTANLNDL